MKQLYTVPIQMEGISQQDAEQRVNKVMDIAAGHKPTVWDFLCMLGVAVLQNRQISWERERALEEQRMRHEATKSARRKRAAKAKKSDATRQKHSDKRTVKIL